MADDGVGIDVDGMVGNDLVSSFLMSQMISGPTKPVKMPVTWINIAWSSPRAEARLATAIRADRRLEEPAADPAELSASFRGSGHVAIGRGTVDVVSLGPTVGDQTDDDAGPAFRTDPNWTMDHSPTAT